MSWTHPGGVRIALAASMLLAPACAPAPVSATAFGEASRGFCERMRAKWLADGLSATDVEDKVSECERMQSDQARSLDRRREEEASARKRAVAADNKREADAKAAADAQADADARAAEEAKAAKVRQWQASAEEKCSTDFAATGCDGAPAEADAEAVETCRMFCKGAVEKALSTRFADAALACADRYVATGGKGKLACEVTLPATAELTGEPFKARLAACSKDCAGRGADLIAAERQRVKDAAKQEADRKKAEAAEKKAEAAEKRAEEARLAAIRKREAFADAYDEQLLRAQRNPDGVWATGAEKRTLYVRAWFCSRQYVHNFANGSDGKAAASYGFNRIECANSFEAWEADF